MTKPDLLMMSSLRSFAVEQLASAFTLHRLDIAEDKQALLQEVGANCRAVILNGKDKLSEVQLAHLPALEIVACTSAGYEGLDHIALEARGIPLTNASLALKDEVADTAVMLTLSTLKELVRADRHVRDGKWQSEGAYPLLHTLTGKRVGIFGFGAIGEEIATRLQAMRMEVAYSTRRKRDVPYSYFPDVAALADWCDVLIVAVPGGAATQNIVDSNVLTRLGAQGTLINIARGSVVDEAALIACLQAGVLGAAGLDVFANEPDPNPELTALPNVTLYPHHASGTVETRRAMTQLAVDNLIAHFAGDTLMSQVKASPRGDEASQ